jgi:hypothetical protein
MDVRWIVQRMAEEVRQENRKNQKRDRQQSAADLANDKPKVTKLAIKCCLTLIK